MKTSALKIVIYAAGAIALCFSIVVRTDYSQYRKWLLNPDIVYDTDIYGDLYQINLVNRFKIPIGPRLPQYEFSDKQPDINDADLLVMGDSFLDHCREKAIPELLTDSLGIKVFYSSHYFSPIYMLDMLKYENGEPKVLIVEVTERYVSYFDNSIPERRVEDEKELQPTDAPQSDLFTNILNYHSQVMKFLFPENQERDYEYLYKRSVLTYPVAAFISSARFELFGFIADQTPVYSLDPPFVFYYETTDPGPMSFFYKHSQDELEDIASNIEFLNNYLWETYHLKLVLFPVPNKISIYHKYVTDDPYNNFLPRLYDELEKRNIQVIKVFDDFVRSDITLYYAADTHWNEHGMNIGFAKSLLKLKEISDRESDATFGKGFDN